MKSIKDSENTKILDYVESLSRKILDGEKSATKILDGEKPATKVHFYFSMSHNNHSVRICKSPIENISVLSRSTYSILC